MCDKEAVELCLSLLHTANADVDVAYAQKPLWGSYLAFINQTQADGAWQLEEPGKGKAVARNWCTLSLHS